MSVTRVRNGRRMASMLHHGLTERGVPVVCIETWQTSQALKSLATHKTDRNDARGLAHLAHTGFFKRVHVKSLPAHAIRSLIIARSKTGRPTGHAGEPNPGPCRGIRRPLTSALSPAFIAKTLQPSKGVDCLSAAMRGLVTARVAVLSAVASIDADIKKLVRASKACRRLMTIPGVGHLTALAFTAAVDGPERFSLAILVPIWGWCRVATNPVRSTTPAASLNAATGECRHCFTKLRTSC